MRRLGLATEVFDDDALLERTLERARLVTAAAPVAQRLHKAALARGGHENFAGALRWESVVQPVTLATRDLREGLRARAERRPAQFTGE